MRSEVVTQSGTLFWKILIPVEFSPCSLEAFRVALQLARVCGAELILLHVIDTKTFEALDRLGLAHVTAEAGQIKRLRRHARIKARELLGWEETKGLSIRRLVMEGIPFVEVGRLVRTERIDLVVLGSWSGETGQIERIFFGSTAEKVVRTAGCPVLTIPLVPRGRRAVNGAHTKEST